MSNSAKVVPNPAATLNVVINCRMLRRTNREISIGIMPKPSFTEPGLLVSIIMIFVPELVTVGRPYAVL